MQIPRNAFQQTMATLRFETGPGQQADIFSRTCVGAWANFDLEGASLTFSQVFEPAVLREVALLEGTTEEALADLTYGADGPIGDLAALVSGADELSVRGLLNLASLLISLSRFSLARQMIKRVSRRAATPAEAFDVAWARFMVSNRCTADAESPAAFSAMRLAITGGGVAVNRALDACTQAVVWFSKRRAVSAADYRWFLETGAHLVSAGLITSAATESAWFRGIAMIPATSGDNLATRRMMDRARDAAERLAADQPGPYADNFLKTYWESTLKEHLYVTRDLTAALDAGAALVALDPGWGPSYAEVAEVHERMGELARAAQCYLEAAQCGPPFVGFHMMAAARCLERVEDYVGAGDVYAYLSTLTPDDARVRERSAACAQAAPQALAGIVPSAGPDGLPT